MRTVLKVSQLGESPLNVAMRERDKKDANGNPSASYLKQVTALKKSISRDGIADPKITDPLSPKAPNWVSWSFLIVEKGAKDLYEVLSGDSRLAALQSLAKDEKDWQSYEVPVQIVAPASDDERREIIARANAEGGEEAGTRLKMSAVTRYQTFYVLAPICHYHLAADGKLAKNGDLEVNGWSSTEYQRRTLCSGNERVTFSALTRLGKHFGFDVKFFNEFRTKIFAQITPALLTKTSAVGEGTELVKEYGLGLEPRYIEALAAAKNKEERATVKENFKSEFSLLMDADGDGSHCYGQEQRELSEEEKEQAKQAKADKANADSLATKTALVASMPFKWQQEAVATALSIPNSPKVTDAKGRAMELLYSMPEDGFTAIDSQVRNAHLDRDTALNALASFILAGTRVQELPIKTAAAGAKKAKK